MPADSDGSAASPNEARVTRQRVAIRELLTETDGFRSAQQLHADLRERGDSIGLATVYRTLGRMVDAGELDAVMRPDGETLYRRCSTGHHHHVVCRRCGVAVEVSGAAVEAWADQVARDSGFIDVSHTVEIFGLCPACQRAG